MRIPVDTIFQEFAARFEIEGWRVECRQLDGNDVVIVHVDSAAPQKPVLEAVKVKDGSLVIFGHRSVEPEAGEPSVVERDDSAFETTRLVDQIEQK